MAYGWLPVGGGSEAGGRSGSDWPRRCEASSRLCVSEGSWGLSPYVRCCVCRPTSQMKQIWMDQRETPEVCEAESKCLNWNHSGWIHVYVNRFLNYGPLSADVLETLHLSYDGARHPANNKAMMCGWFLNNPDDDFNLINTLSVWAARHELNIYEFVNAFIILLQCYWQFVWICGQSWTKLSQDGTTTCPEQRVGTVRLSYTW